jgi:hypothetical protein
MDAIEASYNVTLDDGIVRNPIGPMSEFKLEGYLRSRPLLDVAPDEVIFELQKTGEATVYFQSPSIPLKTRVEIQRLGTSEHD